MIERTPADIAGFYSDIRKIAARMGNAHGAVAYAPQTWNAEQRRCHESTDLDDTMHKASCLAGGWYRRPVTIDVQIRDRDEFYQMRPSDVPKPEGWIAVYTIIAERE